MSERMTNEEFERAKRSGEPKLRAALIREADRARASEAAAVAERDEMRATLEATRKHLDDTVALWNQALAERAAAVRRAEDAEGELKSLRWVVKETPSMQALATLRSQLAQARKALADVRTVADEAKRVLYEFTRDSRIRGTRMGGIAQAVHDALLAVLSPPSPGAETKKRCGHPDNPHHVLNCGGKGGSACEGCGKVFDCTGCPDCGSGVETESGEDEP